MTQRDGPVNPDELAPSGARSTGRPYEPLRPLDSEADRSPALASLVERERDLLVALVGRRCAAARDLASDATARFLDWYARELRETLTATERKRLAEGATAFAARFARRREVAFAGVTCLGQNPTGSRPPEGQTLTALVSLGVTQRRVPRVDLAVAAGAGRELWEEPCSEWVALPAEISPGRYLALTARGRSMEPLLHSGDLILVRLGQELERGTVVVVRHPEDGYVVKRVGTMTPLHVELTSFNPDYPPVRVPRDPSLVLGTVVLRWCEHPGAKHA